MKRIRRRILTCSSSRITISRLPSSTEWSNDMSLIQQYLRKSRSERLSLTFRKELSTSSIIMEKAKSLQRRSNFNEQIWLEREERMMGTTREMLLRMQKARSIRSSTKWRQIVKLMSRIKKNKLMRRQEGIELILKEPLLNVDSILMILLMYLRKFLKRAFMTKLSIRQRIKRRTKMKRMRATKLQTTYSPFLRNLTTQTWLLGIKKQWRSRMNVLNDLKRDCSLVLKSFKEDLKQRLKNLKMHLTTLSEREIQLMSKTSLNMNKKWQLQTLRSKFWLKEQPNITEILWISSLKWIRSWWKILD